MIGNNLRMMPNLITDEQGIFRVNFQYNEQITDLQTVLQRALYNSDNPTLQLTNRQWHLVLWIVKICRTNNFVPDTRTRTSGSSTRSPRVI